MLRVLLASVAAAAWCACASAQNDDGGNFPVEIPLQGLTMPVGVVAALDTNIYVSSVSGQLYEANIKSGEGTLLNAGGDGQALSGLCLDSRGEGTLYAGGRETGLLYAFARDGTLLRQYEITPPSTKEEPHFIAGCIQTQYMLIITDAFGDAYYWLPLSDETGPERGKPPPRTDTKLQGFKVPYRGEWEQLGTGFNAYGVEWKAKWNTTAFIMNSATGDLFHFPLDTKNIRKRGGMRKVAISGKQKSFPGALGVLFDSTNENIFYIALPARQGIAVLEFDFFNPSRAKYIRTLTSQLMNGPFAISEYGDAVYPLSGQFNLDPAKREKATYSIVQLPRHKQILDSDAPANTTQYTTLYDDVEEPPRRVDPDATPKKIEKMMRDPPPKTGVAPMKPALDEPEEDSSAESSDPPAESNVGDVFNRDAENRSESSEDGSSCFPGSATVELESGTRMRMDGLQLGDRVLVHRADGESLYSPIYIWTHRDSRIESSFVRVESLSGALLMLTSGHYMYINGKLAAASTVSVGDEIDVMEADGIRRSNVTAVDTVPSKGLFNPQTLDGDIVVDDVRVSTFTTAVAPPVASALLAPIRLAHGCGVTWPRRFLTDFFEHGSVFLSALSPPGPDVLL